MATPAIAAGNWGGFCVGSLKVENGRGGQDGESAWTEFWSVVEFAVGLSDDQIVVSRALQMENAGQKQIHGVNFILVHLSPKKTSLCYEYFAPRNSTALKSCFSRVRSTKFYTRD